MTLSEKSAYLKGLMDGLQMDAEKPEVKMIRAIVDMLEDVGYAIADVEENARTVSDELDLIEEELDTLGSIVFDEDGEYDEDDDFDYDDALYEVKCPKCGEQLIIDEDLLEDGFTDCPNCGERLEFDTDDLEEFELDDGEPDGDSEF